MPSRASSRFPSTLASVTDIERLAADAATSAHFAEQAVHEIALAVREAAINAVRHGNAFSPDRFVSVVVETSAPALTISVSDEGSGFLPEQVPDPLIPENLLKGSGRGLFLMRASMDNVRVESGPSGSTITLTKRRLAEASA